VSPTTGLVWRGKHAWRISDPTDTESSSGSTDTFSPVDRGTVSDEVIDACNEFVTHLKTFNDVSNSLLKPGTTVDKAVKELEESGAALSSDANAFEEINDAQAAQRIRRVAEAIGALAAAIESSGSGEAGIKSERTRMQSALLGLGQVQATCP
jgi:hypothetical protein